MEWTGLTYSVVDVEGNGQRPPDLVELAVVPIVGGVIGEAKSWLVAPKRPIRYYATRIHGLTNDDVKDRPPFTDVEHEVRQALDGTVIVAHNAHVDVDVLSREIPAWLPVEVFDTLKLARRLEPEQNSYQLGKLAEAFRLAEGMPNGLSPHRATYDALVAAKLFVHLAQERPLKDLVDIVRGQEGKDDERPALF